MDSKYDHKTVEPQISKLWQDHASFTAKRDPKKKPFTIILPPPNASGKMHTGNVLMIAIEDILIRWKRMQGYDALWVPGTDHAGFETQSTFERELKKQGKSRFDYDRKTFYDLLMTFVLENKGLIESQITRMGASVDWSRYLFTLDKRSVSTVLDTFVKLHNDNKVYRANYLVNYSFKHGTTFSDAEIIYQEQKRALYYVRFKLLDRKEHDPEYIVLATTRPETIYVDKTVAINPKDKTKAFLKGRKLENPLTQWEMQVIEDSFVDPAFGTGIVKITPAHDKNDFEVGRKHGLEVLPLITLEGRLNEHGMECAGMTVLKAREAVVERLQKEDMIERIDTEYMNLAPVDYRTEDYIEQLVVPNWFVKVDEMKEVALQAVKKGEIKIHPKWREITYTQWVENMYDWAISRQVVWGIQIPAWYNVDENPNIQVTFLTPAGETEVCTIAEALKKYSVEDIEKGIQKLIAPNDARYVVSKEKPGGRFLQETDTFDTWFSSGQWPLVTLGYPDSEDFKYFYPTDVLETGWEIVTRWVSRMVMFGYYLTGKPPFKHVYLHGMVRALDGKKMSKSLNNVVNPEEYIEQYGTDALRMGLISGTANGKDFRFPKDKVTSYRNFTNKIWNMTRFWLMMVEKDNVDVPFYSTEMDSSLTEKDKEMLRMTEETGKSVQNLLEKYRFAEAGETIYHFMWDTLASDYLEHVKTREDASVALSVFRHIFLYSLKLLHPFMPFVTEAVWAEIPHEGEKLLAESDWPVIVPHE